MNSHFDLLEGGYRRKVSAARSVTIVSMTVHYKVALTHSDEGVSISVPGLPGCWSQGRDENEALENIRDAIREYLAVAEQQLQGADIREVEVSV